jgi:3-hydroxyisobutyrate dehydrogenase-like beta-hydroxyacid dehydrogenase
MVMRIGFAGIGRMGLPMSSNLARAGHEVWAYDPYAVVDHELAASGVASISSAAQLGECDVSVSMLPDAAAALALLSGDAGVFAFAKAGHRHIAMGTIGLAAARQLEQAASRFGVHLVDAPVSGSTTMAEDATLTTMVGASVEDFAAVRPLLACMTRAQFHAGAVGTGSVLKLAVNSVIAALNEAIAETIVLTDHEGINRETYYDVLQASAAGAPYVQYKREAFLDPDRARVSSPISIIDKDMKLATELISVRALNLPLIEACTAMLRASMADGDGARDMAEVLRAVTRRSSPS